ncbi:hypothetical protein LMG28614_02048 [Paraburkholderia ultramafica]|uniref:Uncharacterized protein n=1 Tax=Paraburkholderia ultramafica TaxID=1544867 RepID=A0A6S7B1S9_9BURK|nr:hypothetical protein LMG28614_02048 [Paraburkholderia ultramafica]
MSVWTAASVRCFIWIRESSERAENLPIVFAVQQRATSTLPAHKKKAATRAAFFVTSLCALFRR